MIEHYRHVPLTNVFRVTIFDETIDGLANVYGSAERSLAPRNDLGNTRSR